MTQELAPRPMLLEEFTPLVGKLMRVDSEPTGVDITLVEATALKDQDIGLRPPFVLLFHSDEAVRLAPGIYAMRSGSFGPDLIYLEATFPPANAPAGNYYQAVFN